MKNMKKALCLFLALVMCLGMLPMSALAARDEELPGEAPQGDALSSARIEGLDTANQIPAKVQAFLDAVDAIPADINAGNAEAAGVPVNAAFDAYEALVDAGLDDYDGVADALAKVEAAYAAIDKALGTESSTYAGGTVYEGDSLAGFGTAVGYDPHDTTKFPKTDGTDISVIPWDFHNPDHAKDYYYYTDYRLGYNDGKTHPRTEPAPDPVQSSYFEKTYNWTYLPYYAPLEFSKAATAGKTSALNWRQGVTNFNDPWGGSMPTIPSVYLYRLEEVTGTDYIDGGRDGISFKANDEVVLESSGGPVYRPTGPNIECDVPVSKDAPNGAQIQVRFRLAMGYEMEWDSSEGTYDWYVQDFILNLTVGATGSPDAPTAGVTKYHDLYIPAGGYSTVMSFSEFYYDYYSTSYCTLSDNDYVQGDEAVASITGSELVPMNNTSRRNTYNDVTIQSGANANPGDTTTLYATYTATSPYGVYDGQETCVDVITVHIILPREEPLEVDEEKTFSSLGSSADGTLSTNGTVFRFNKGDKTIVSGSNNKGTQAMTLTGKSEGTAEIERQYHYYRNDSSTGDADYLTTYVDVVKVTVGNASSDDPDSIDGLDILKEADKPTVVGGQELTYIITVTNDSGVDKTVTVTDPLPNGVTFKSFEPDDGTAVLAKDGFNVTWTPTVPSKGSSVLRITCTVADNARGYLTNVARMTTADGGKDEATAQPTATPKPQAPALTISKSVQVMQGTQAVNATSVSVGGTLKYTITVTNTGKADATGVVVKDELPPQLATSFLSSTPNDYTLTHSGSKTVASWNLGTIAPGAANAKTITFTVNTVAPGVFQNAATVSCTEIPEDAEHPIEGRTPDTYVYQLDVTKSNTGFVKDANEKNKATVQYTVAVTNKSGYPLHGAGILDTMIARVLNSDTNEPATGVTMTLKPVSMTLPDGTVITKVDELGGEQTIESGSNQNLWNALDRSQAFAKDATITLVYNIEMVNNSTVKVYVALDNTAMGGAWTTAVEPEANALAPRKGKTRDAVVNPGWDATAEANNKVSIGTSSSGGFLDPVDPEDAYTVTWFDPDQANPVKTETGVKLTNGEVPQDKYPNDPATPGHWGDPVIDNDAKTVTITWVKNPIVTFDPNGGNWNNDTTAKTASVGADGKVTPAGAPARTNKIFDGWYTAQTNGEKVDFATTTFTKNTTLYAHWLDDVLTDPDNDQNGTEPGDGIPDQFQREVTFKVSNGYWNEGENDNGDKKVVVTLMTDGTPNENGTATLTAPAVGNKPLNNTFKAGGWSPALPEAFTKDSATVYTYAYAPKGTNRVTFNSHGGSDVPAQDVLEGGKATEPTDPTKPGFVFDKWTTDEDGNVPYDFDDVVDAPITLHAHWFEDSLTDPDNDGNGTEPGDGIPDQFQREVTFKVSNGYWNAGENDNGDKKVVVTLMTDGTPNENGTATLTAPAVGNKPLNNTFKAGGWSPALPEAFTKDSATVYTYAYAPKGTNHVTFNSHGGSDVPAQDVLEGGKATEPTDPTKPGFVFDKWTTDEEGNVPYDFDDVVDAPITLHAQWFEDSLTDPDNDGNGTEPGDGIPDQFQATVTLNISNGTWGATTGWTNADGTLTKVYTLYEKNAETGVWEAKAAAVGALPTGNANSGYTGGTWNPALTANTAVTGDATYTLTYTRSSTGGGGGNNGGTNHEEIDIPDDDVPLAGVDGNLNTTDHFSYIIGRGNGCVQPLEDITRAEVATIFFRLMTEEFRVANWATVSTFPDVDADAWYSVEIATAEKAGILHGCDDGTMQPDRSITRAEFTVMAIRFLNSSVEDDGTGDFSDTANHWAAKEIRLAVKAGWIKGFGNEFRPNDPITRAEAMTIINRMLDRVPGETFPEGTIQWGDNPEDAWYYADVMEATNGHEYDREEGSMVEKWTAITPHYDWIALEAEWVANDGASAPDPQ